MTDEKVLQFEKKVDEFLKRFELKDFFQNFFSLESVNKIAEKVYRRALTELAIIASACPPCLVMKSNILIDAFESDGYDMFLRDVNLTFRASFVTEYFELHEEVLKVIEESKIVKKIFDPDENKNLEEYEEVAIIVKNDIVKGFVKRLLSEKLISASAEQTSRFVSTIQQVLGDEVSIEFLGMNPDGQLQNGLDGTFSVGTVS